MSNHLLTRDEVKDIYNGKASELSDSGIYITPKNMNDSIRSIRDNRMDLDNTKKQILKIVQLGKDNGDSLDIILAVIQNIPGITAKLKLDELEDLCIDTVLKVFNETPGQSTGNNLPVASTIMEQPIAARNLGFDPSAFIRQPQPQQPNMVMGQMYNPTTFIATPQSANTVQGGNASHGNNCQCPECKGSPYWNNMNDSDKIDFIKQHYELLDIHKRNVSSDEVNALINLIKNPDTINRLIKLGYTGDGSSLRLKEVPPAKYNEYGKGIFNRYYEVPVGSNNIVICYNTKGELNADGYMMYTLQVKRDSELK